MRNRFGQALRIGIASDGIAVVAENRWRRKCTAVLAERRFSATARMDVIGQHLRELLAAAGVSNCSATVVLSDELIRMWQVVPPGASSRFVDIEAATALRFQSLFGGAAADWKIEADWDPVSPFLAAATPVALLAQLQTAANAHRIHLVEIVPRLVAAMNRWRKLRKPGAWFGVLCSGVLTYAMFDGAALVAIRSIAVPDGGDRKWFETLVEREALRQGLDCPLRFQLCGPVPAAWLSPVRLEMACSLLENGVPVEWSAASQLACAGSTA